MYVQVNHDTCANIFSNQIYNFPTNRENIYEIDKRAKTAFNRVGNIYNDIQKFDYRPQYSDAHSQKIFSKVKEHLIVKNLESESDKKRFYVTKKLFEVFYPLDEEDYQLEDIVRQIGVSCNPAIFKKRKSLLVVQALANNKDKNKNKEALADILKNIKELRENFLHKPKPVKIIKNSKQPIEINSITLKKLKTLSKTQFSHLDDPNEKKKEVDKQTLVRLSSPKRVHTKIFRPDSSGNNTSYARLGSFVLNSNNNINDNINNVSNSKLNSNITSRPATGFAGNFNNAASNGNAVNSTNDKINAIFNRLMSGKSLIGNKTASPYNSPLRLEKRKPIRINCSFCFLFIYLISPNFSAPVLKIRINYIFRVSFKHM